MIDIGDFPNSDDLIRGFWRPVYFRANFDTPERLVAAVIANVDGRWSVKKANALDRLKCLYGRESSVAIAAIETGLEDLESRTIDGMDIENTALAVSGLELGDAHEGQAVDAANLAARWLRLISSLHDGLRVDGDVSTVVQGAEGAPNAIEKDIARDRLPVLVMSQMVERAPEARNLFNPHVRKLQEAGSVRRLTHTAYVAYDGRKVAANFSTLKAGRYKPAVDVAKRLMWDLEQHRERRTQNLYGEQAHEMYLYHPAENDPTISEKQFENVMEVVATLTDEGKAREIKVVANDSVEEISETLLKEDGLV